LGTKDELFFTGAGMVNRLDYLLQEWHNISGAVLLNGSNFDVLDQ